MLLFVFDDRRLPPSERDAMVVDGQEVIGYGFHDLAELAAVTITRRANRIEHATVARQDGTTRNLGRPSRRHLNRHRPGTSQERAGV